MSVHRGLMWTLVVGAALACFTPEAEARRGHGGDRFRDRIRLVEAVGGPIDARQARIRLERRRDRQEFRIQIEGAPSGLNLEVWMENDAGVLVEVASMEEDDPGEYRWRLRTKKGDPLPFGVADLSELSGRKVEIRTAAGTTAFVGAIRTIPAPRARTFVKRPLESSLVVDETVAAALGAEDATAEVEVSRRRNGDESFEVEVENAPSGLEFVLWMEDAAGAIVEVGPLTEEADDDEDDEEVEHHRRGFFHGFGDDDDDEIGCGDLLVDYVFEVEIDGDDSEPTPTPFTLPVGATSVCELAGRVLEIRTADGQVFATGTVPELASLPVDDDDDDDDDHDDDDDDDDDDEDDD